MSEQLDQTEGLPLAEQSSANGTIRNKQMLEEESIHLVLAFHNNLSQSHGTADMIHQSQKKNLPVLLINSQGKAKEM